MQWMKIIIAHLSRLILLFHLNTYEWFEGYSKSVKNFKVKMLHNLIAPRSLCSERLAQKSKGSQLPLNNA